MPKKTTTTCTIFATLAFASLSATFAYASSHMDAPLITLDDSANTTDVYAFKSTSGGKDYLTTALSVYPFEEPGIGPNTYRFDHRVDYEINVVLGAKHTKSGTPDLTYRFEFDTTYKNAGTILQGYLGPLVPGATFPENQNLRQTYTVTKIDHRSGKRRVLGKDLLVPPNNQGRLTPDYNQGNNGDQPAKEGVAIDSQLDGFTTSAIHNLSLGYRSFAGQRDDGFYADIQSIFDLDFGFAKPAPFDSQGGFNVHTIVLNIPMEELKNFNIAGVYAATYRHSDGRRYDNFQNESARRQVGRQGNPLFVEALIAIKDKNKYNASLPKDDSANFKTYAANPELAAALGSIPIIPGLLESIFIPDLIKVDLTTGPAKLSGQLDFNRLSVFGGDVLQSTFQDPFNNGGKIPGGWPNGRRFGDDVVDIAIIALGAAGAGPYTSVDVDKVNHNDITYNQVFPYAATPLNGRVHGHHGN
jgi:Domain of unknown function (DUF4331)